MTNRLLIKNRKVSITPEQRRQKPSLCLEQAPAVIIHPSFCTPAIMAANEPITLFILGTEVLAYDYFQYRTEKLPPLAQFPKQGDEWICGRINRMLQVRPWSKVTGDPKTYKKITQQDKPLFPLDATAHQNMTCTLLARIGTEIEYGETLMENVFLKDSKDNYLGKLKTSMAEFYVNHGYNYLFRVEIKNHKLTNGLYDLHWITLDEKAHYDKQINPQNRLTPLENLEDMLLLDALTDYHTPLTEAYNLNNMENGFYQPDPDNPIQSYHPIYITEPKDFTIGQLTDIHVSSRHFALQKSTAQLIMGTSTSIGEKLHISFNSTKQLLDEIGKEVDILVITGDLLDYCRNLDPNKVTIKKPGDIWNVLDLQKFYQDEKMQGNHPYGIDDTLVFSLIKHYYDTYQKPVYFVTGNHDSYQMPYGISPRFASIRTNPGIPADHNLTIPEAILMFGPSYNKILKKLNFDSKYSDWFFHVFTPLSDFAIPLKNNILLGLEWGNDESFIHEPKHLPVANETMSYQQDLFLQNVLKQKKPCVLCTHPIIVNYADNYPLSTEGMVNDILNDKYSVGSFKLARIEFFNKFLITNRSHYTLSGHSHRSGFYAIQSSNIFSVTTKGEPLDEAKPQGQSTRIIVTGSGGPIPIQNLNGEMQGFGLDIPTATTINLATEEIKVLRSDVPTAKPRFAVAMDYYDLIGNGVFRNKNNSLPDSLPGTKFSRDQDDEAQADDKAFISSKNDPYTFTATLDEGLPKVRFIEDITFYGYSGNKQFSEISITPVITENKVNIKFDGKDFNSILIKAIDVIFMSIKFKGDALSNQPGFKHYDFDSPWIIRMQIDKKSKGGFRIRRHEIHGEIPDLKWYRKNFAAFQIH